MIRNLRIIYFNHSKKFSTGKILNHGNVSAKEIEYFGGFHKIWWDKDGPFRALHDMNPLRVDIVKNGLCSTGVIEPKFLKTDHPLKGIKILEIGCGGGILTKALARLKGEITALEPAEDLRKCAIENLVNTKEKFNVEILSNSVEEHSINNKEIYDVVVISEVIEHIIEKDIFLAKSVETLKPGGSIFITTLNKTLFSKFFGIVVAERLLKLVPEGSHDHEQFISPEDCSKILEKYGCKILYQTGMFYKFWQNKWILVEQDDINYCLHAIKLPNK